MIPPDRVLDYHVETATTHLTDMELAALNNIAQVGQDPRGRLFDYEKVEMLFDRDRKMHNETKKSLARIVNNRLGQSASPTPDS